MCSRPTIPGPMYGTLIGYSISYHMRGCAGIFKICGAWIWLVCRGSLSLRVDILRPKSCFPWMGGGGPSCTSCMTVDHPAPDSFVFTKSMSWLKCTFCMEVSDKSGNTQMAPCTAKPTDFTGILTSRGCFSGDTWSRRNGQVHNRGLKQIIG